MINCNVYDDDDDNYYLRRRQRRRQPKQRRIDLIFVTRKRRNIFNIDPNLFSSIELLKTKRKLSKPICRVCCHLVILSIVVAAAAPHHTTKADRHQILCKNVSVKFN